MACARCPAPISKTPIGSRWKATNTSSGTCRPSPTRACSVETPTGAAPCGFRSTSLIVRALLQYYRYYGDSFKIECPTGSGQEMTLFEVAKDLADRLISIFLQDEEGRRPVYGGTEKFQTDPYWRDLLSFHEYFHGDNGAGIGASHQTGWTGTVARLIQLFGEVDAEDALHAAGGLLAYGTQGRPVATPH